MKEKRTALRFMKGASVVILQCFHPSEKRQGVSIEEVERDGHLRTITGVIVMKGNLRSYGMRVKVELDHDTDKMRVTPMEEDTVFPASPTCGLREWTDIDDAGTVASEAVAELKRGLLAGAVLATAMLSKSTAERRVPTCLHKAILDAAVDDAVKDRVDGMAHQAIASGAIKQAYADDPSAGGVARDALSYALVEAVRARESALADVLDAAAVARCLADE